MDGIKVKVYAKINLSLDVAGVREDGYHLLDMLNTSADIFDTVCACKSDTCRVIMDGKEADGGNSAVRALKLLKDNFGINMRVEIVKGIPFSAGLGGSSADASATFFCAHKLFGIEWTELERLALEVGCDAPYMMSGGGARVRGVGEVVIPVALPKRNLVVFQYSLGASTKDAYSKFDGIGAYPVRGEYFNALEKAAVALKPDIAVAKEQLLKFTDKVFMSGSGSAYVGVFDTAEDAQHCLENLNGGIFKAVAKTVDQGIEVI